MMDIRGGECSHWPSLLLPIFCVALSCFSPLSIDLIKKTNVILLCGYGGIGEMSIYDGDVNSGSLLYHCADCSAAPDRLSSKAGFYVTFITGDISHDKGVGFLANYYSEFISGMAMGNGVERWSSPASGHFAPPQNKAGSYLMTIDNSPTKNEANLIMLSFLEVQAGFSDCSTDRLVVYDGGSVSDPRIVQLCGGQDDSVVPSAWIVSTGSQLTFELVSASHIQNNEINFLAQYVSEHSGGWTPHCGLSHTPMNLRVRSMVSGRGQSILS